MLKLILLFSFTTTLQFVIVKTKLQKISVSKDFETIEEASPDW